MKFFSILLVAALVLSTAVCKASFAAAAEYTLKIDNSIDEEMKAEIDKYNNKIIDCIRNNKVQEIYDLFSDEVKKKQPLSNVENFLSKVSPAVKKMDFTKRGEYYVNFLLDDDGKEHVVYDSSLDKQAMENFVIKLQPISKTQYLSFWESKGYFQDYLLSFLYYKNKAGKWELIHLHIGVNKVLNKNAVEQYKYAKNLYEKKYYTLAMLRMVWMKGYLNPSVFLQYKEEPEINSFFEKLSNEVNKEYTFPVTINEVSSKPEIYGLKSLYVEKDFVPVVQYYSALYKESSAVLGNEVESIGVYLEKYFPGITKDSPKVLFQVFSEQPLKPDKEYSTRYINYELKK